MKKALAFSGGKDSWACLWLHEAELADIHVLWVNTGKNYPELLCTIERAAAMCPNFHEVKSDRARQNYEWGLPADVVPVKWTRYGQTFTGPTDVTLQPYIGCCHQNIAVPLHRAALELGCTHLIRGQRNDEGHVSPARDGATVEGLVYLQPIENWSAENVLAYLRTKMDLPEHFALKHSSMDCYDCTAYRSESKDRIEFMRERHPALFALYDARREAVDRAVQSALREGE